MERIKISVIIPLYNGEQYIEETLVRILNSSYKNLEVVVIDDGSSDKGVEICKKVREKDSRVVVFSKENGGIADARNYGVQKATGQYLCFCDQDDFVEPYMYEKLLTQMEKDNSDIAMCSTGRWVNGKKLNFEINENEVIESDEVAEKVLYPMLFHGYKVTFPMSKNKRYPSIWNHMYKRSFWDKYNFKFRLYVSFEDDVLINADTLSRKPKVSLIEYIGYYWRVNLKSESYAHRFVSNLEKKQKEYQNDIMNCLSRTSNNEKDIQLMYQILRNKQWLEAVHILTSPMAPKSKKEIRRYYERTIFTSDFEQCKYCFRNVCRGYIKAKVILPLISRKKVLLSLFAEKMIDRILLFTLRSSVITQIEKKIKGME